MSEAEEPKPKPELIDIKADIVFPYKLGPDSSVLCLVGNFAAQHNGAVITADSAVRYGNDRLDCFGNVLINKNTTYAYADRAVYDGIKNEIRLYSPIVKLVDEGVTLYAYNFKYNTLDNIGTYWDGGVATNADSSRLESVKGYYYSDLKEVVGVENVEIYTTTYDLKSDSVIYNMETDHARFFENTNIWNKKGEYLYNDSGFYDKEEDKFSFNLNGYILTAEQEVWSDSLDYYQALDETILRNNIQMNDTTNKMLVYSDFAHHWGGEEKLFLSKRPLVVNYDPEQADTLFMRGDTIIITTHRNEIEPLAEQIAEVVEDASKEPETTSTATPHRGQDAEDPKPISDSIPTIDSLAQNPEIAAADTLSKKEKKELAKAQKIEQKENERIAAEQAKVEREELIEANLQQAIAESLQAKAKAKAAADSVAMAKVAVAKDSTNMVEVDSLVVITTPDVVVDSLSRDSVAITLTDEEIEELRALVIHKIKIAEQKQQAEAKRLRVEAISRERIRQRAEKMDAQKARAARAAAKRKAKIDARRIKRGKTTAEEIAAADSLDSLRVVDSLNFRDSIRMADSLSKLPPVDTTAVKVAETKIDSIYRLVVSYRNAKTFQGEQQSVSDSLVVDSRDSTLRLYINPYIWNGLNQVSSDVMDIYTRNKELDRAVFTGTPIMASKIDTTYYNQVTGKTITSYFRDNEIIRNDVESNVQTIYFAQDEDTKEVTTMVYLESGSASFYIKDQELEGITYRISPSYIFYPIGLIPATQSMRLDGFEWKEELRPVRGDFSDREHRPSVRQEKSEIPRPEFPIERSLRIDINNYVKNKHWMDRNDVVTSQVEEWLESLGHKSGQPRTKPIK